MDTLMEDENRNTVEVDMESDEERADGKDEDEISCDQVAPLVPQESWQKGESDTSFSRHPSIVSRLSSCDLEGRGSNASRASFRCPRVRRLSTSSKKNFTVINYGNAIGCRVVPGEDSGDEEFPPTSPTFISAIEEDGNADGTSSSSRGFHGSWCEEKRPSDACDGVTVDANGLHVVHSATLGKKYSEVAKRGRLFARRKKDRLVQKDGNYNVTYKKVSQRGSRYLLDIFTTMLELKWRYHIVLFLCVFVVSWIVFALLWWAIVTLHSRGNHAAASNGTSVYEPCVIGVDDFGSALLFSIETQHTIGYGTRAITTSCPLGTFVIMLQSMYGTIMQCVLTGMIFAKLARPKGRSSTILFSKNAVISQRDGNLCLSFRVGDIRESTILGISINALLVQRKVTHEGEDIPFFHKHLSVTTESEDTFFFLAWPIVVVHKIDDRSPLWDIGEEKLLVGDFEIVVFLEAQVEATGSTVQVRTSYLPSEILWGHTLAPLHTKHKAPGQYSIDYTRFHETTHQNIQKISAKDLATERKSKAAASTVHFPPTQLDRVFCIDE